jgi:hypothetical protein
VVGTVDARAHARIGVPAPDNEIAVEGVLAMSVTDHDRNQLFAWFEEHMGKERADTMMRMLPAAGSDDLATKRDIHVAVERLDATIDHAVERMDAKIDHAVERMDAKIDHSVGRLDLRIDHLTGQMATKADLQALRSDLQRTFVTWILTGQVVVVTALGALLAIFR